MKSQKLQQNLLPNHEFAIYLIMPKKTLRPADEPTIKGLVDSDVETTMAGLRGFLSRSLWLGTTNHYRTDVVKRLRSAPPTTVEKQRNLAQYIAASSPLHANDGWSYLGRSVSSLLAGDAHRALHLAYYSELRAAMSLLASRGVGIFDHQHFVISGVNQTKKLATRDGTHMMTWLMLEAWALVPESGDLFATLVRPEGKTLNEWFQPQGGASVLAPQAKDWFMQWGMDLNLGTEDRAARNSSSYRPDGVPETWAMNTEETLEFVKDLWSLLEPNASSSFDQIDRHILRLAIEGLFQGRMGRTPNASRVEFSKLVQSLVSEQGFIGPTAQRMTRFLLRELAPEDPQIFIKSREKPKGTQSDVFLVLSRAVLLLRVASGSSHSLLSRANLDTSVLKFWCESIGEVRGLWVPGNFPEALSDLWADVYASLDEIKHLENTMPRSLATPQAIMSSIPREAAILSSHERVGLWAICPS